MSKIELKHIDKFYGKNHILKDVNLTIEDGDFMTLLGPSGCGKTTTLRVVSGLEKPQNGTIHMDGKEIVNAAEAHFAPPSENKPFQPLRKTAGTRPAQQKGYIFHFFITRRSLASLHSWEITYEPGNLRAW